MNNDRYTEEDLALLNSKVGLYALLKNKKLDLNRALEEAKKVVQIKALQEELIKLQDWVITNNKKVVILFEGRDAAGKGGAIRRITEYINPRFVRTIALNIPTEDERKQWYFQRYIKHLPKPSEIVLFDRSWYNRAVVEPVNGFCTDQEYEVFMNQINDFEKMLVNSDTYLIKFYFSITKGEQAKRFKDIKNDPLKRWKITAVDERAQELWDKYTDYKNKMFAATNSELVPWKIIEADKKSSARLEAIKHVLEVIPYKN